MSQCMHEFYHTLGGTYFMYILIPKTSVRDFSFLFRYVSFIPATNILHLYFFEILKFSKNIKVQINYVYFILEH